MIYKNGEVYFIDFGLGFISKKFEDKAVDIHVLKEALEARMLGQYIAGVTGAIACGKSYICDKLVELGSQVGVVCRHLLSANYVYIRFPYKNLLGFYDTHNIYQNYKHQK